MRPLVLLLFFLSGACGLVYEVAWTRLLTHVFGTTAQAVGTALAAFMAGLAAGSWLVGRLGDRTARPLRAYAWLELGVAAAALLSHLLLLRLAPLYLGVYEACGRSALALGLARFGLAFVLVMAPTVLMGATLPVLARHVTRQLTRLGADLGSLYALNTLGAMAGALATGFLLLGALGINGTVAVALAGNILVSVLAWMLSRRVETGLPGAAAPAAAGPGGRGAQGAGRTPGGTSPPGAAPARRRPAGEGPGTGAADDVHPGPRTWRLVLVGLLLSGLASLAYEVLWMRSLVFLLGSSTYAVTTMLVAFLGGIALGGWLVRWLADRVRDRVALFGWLQLLIGVSAVLALPALFTWLSPQGVRLLLGHAVEDPGRLLLLRFAVALAVMLVPATFIGATFPLVGRMGVVDLGSAGSAIGRVYAVNTLGNVAGALLPAWLLLPWLGIQRSLLLLASLNAAIGLVLLAPRVLRSRGLRFTLPPALVAVGAALAMAPLSFRFPAESQSPWHRVLFYREGPSATTMVLQDPEKGELSMSVDGIEIGGTLFTDYKQQLLAHLPKLLLDEVSPELSIGLGSGILAGESLRHEGLQRLVCVEIEPGVAEGAALFAERHGDVLADPRLELVVEDVATHLLTTDDVYQVVSADEKTAQDHASNGFSYSLEYYQLLRQRLAPGGVVVQWVPTTLPPSQYRMVLATFTTAFPSSLLFYFLPALQEGAANTLLVGSQAPLSLDVQDISRRLATGGGAFEGLAAYGLTQPEAVLAQLVADGDALREALEGTFLNTFDRPRYEFYAPADYVIPRVERLAVNHAWLAELRRAALPRLLGPQLVPGPQGAAADSASRLAPALAAEEAYHQAFAQALAGSLPPDATLAAFDRALERAPWNESLRARVALEHWQAGEALTGVRRYPEALDQMSQAVALHDHSALRRAVQATLLSLLGRGEEALVAARRAVELDPSLVAGRRVLAETLLGAGRRAEAREQLRALLAIEPGDAAARDLLAQLDGGA